MSLDLLLYTVGIRSARSSVALENNMHFLFSVKEKYQTLTPPSEDGTRYIVRDVDGTTMIRAFAIELSDLGVYDMTEKLVLQMLSYLCLIPQWNFHDLTQEISTLACEATKTALEEKNKFVITVDLEFLIREECQGIEVVGGDEEPSFIVVPASRSSVDALDTTKYDKGDSVAVETCMVCMEEFLVGVDVTRMPCSHIFHGGCIVKWLENRNTCPLCRFEMPTEP